MFYLKYWRKNAKPIHIQSFSTYIRSILGENSYKALISFIKRKIKYQFSYITRYQARLRTKDPGTKADASDYLKRKKAYLIPYYRFYSLPLRLRQPHKVF